MGTRGLGGEHGNAGTQRRMRERGNAGTQAQRTPFPSIRTEHLHR